SSEILIRTEGRQEDKSLLTSDFVNEVVGSPINTTMDRNDDDDSNMSGNKERGRDRDRDRQRRGDRPSRFGPRSASRDRDRGGRKSAAERRIFVSNIAYEFRWQELKDLFRTEVGEVAYVELFTDENDKPRGCGIVEFESADSVKKAVEKMHRYELKGRKLVVKEDFDVERDKYGRPLKSVGGGGGGGSVSANRLRDEPRGRWDPAPGQASLGQAGASPSQKWGNTYGLSPQFLESLCITGPLGTKVFVANLDYKVDEKKLKEVFKLAGKVVNVELSLDKEGKSRGFGVVEYEHPVEAVQAISMLHNQMLYDRKLTVRMDRADQKPDGPPKLPEGLRAIGMGLGAGGAPLQDVARNLPNSQQVSSGLVASVPAGAAAGLGAAGLGLGNTAGLPANLAGVGGLGAGGLVAGGAGEIGLGASLGGAAGAFAGSGLATGLGAAAAATGLGAGLGGAAAALGGGNSYGGGVGSSYGSGVGDRYYRGSSAGGSNHANGPARGGTGAGNRTSDTVIVKNLPPSTTWQMLRDKFREVGDVEFAEMRGKDFGLVRFTNEWDAERAT
ncbi:Uncharacterized protein GBIM_18560, partial [Gryllus bimaculatus]